MDDSTRVSIGWWLQVAAYAAVALWLISFAIRSALKRDRKDRSAVAGAGRRDYLWEVSGTDQNGAPTRERIWAPTKEEAEHRAAADGMRVTAVRASDLV